MPKVEHLVYGDRKVFTVSAFNRGVGMHLGRLPTVWVEGEVTELRRNDAWANVFVTLKDPKTGATLGVTIARRTYDRLDLGLEEGESVHVAGRAELYELRGQLGLRATTIERLGLGGHLVALEQLKRKLSAEGLFAAERKRRLPHVPRAIGILTGADAAARGDLVATIGARFPATRVVVCETRVQGKGAADAIVAAIGALTAHPEVDVVVLARGGGSFEDLLPFSDEAVVRAVASSRVAIVSAVGHEQDTPLCDLAADAACGDAHRCRRSRRAGSHRARRRPRLDATKAGARGARPARAQPKPADATGRASSSRAAPAARAPSRGARSRRREAADALAARNARPRLRDRPCQGGRGPRRGGGRGGGRSRDPARDGLPRRDRGRGAAVSESEARSFEELQRELEEIVTRLERGDVPVDEAIGLFRRGEELYKACVARLQGVELQIEELAPPGSGT